MLGFVMETRRLPHDVRDALEDLVDAMDHARTAAARVDLDRNTYVELYRDAVPGVEKLGGKLMRVVGVPKDIMGVSRYDNIEEQVEAPGGGGGNVLQDVQEKDVGAEANGQEK